jgi:hypothetical protein
MLEKNKIAPQRASELTGEFSALAEKLGSSELAELRLTTDGLELSHVRSLPELRRFLQKYMAQVLVNSELRTIHQAYRHSSCAEGRELIALDVSLQKEPLCSDIWRRWSEARPERGIPSFLGSCWRSSPCHCGKGCSITPRRR